MSSRAVAGTPGPWSRTRSALTNVSGGTSVMTLADPSNLRIVGAIDEAQIGRLQAGQQVDIRVDAHPDCVFQGVIDRVSPLGNGKETSSVVTGSGVMVTSRLFGSKLGPSSATVEILHLLEVQAIRRIVIAKVRTDANAIGQLVGPPGLLGQRGSRNLSMWRSSG